MPGLLGLGFGLFKYRSSTGEQGDTSLCFASRKPGLLHLAARALNRTTLNRQEGLMALVLIVIAVTAAVVSWAIMRWA